MRVDNGVSWVIWMCAAKEKWSLMIIRLATELGAKIHVQPQVVLPLDPHPLADWSARGFTSDRVRYVLVTNTVSLFSVVFYGKGVTDSHVFLGDFLRMLREVTKDLGMAAIHERFIAPTTGSILFSKALNRSITGSMNDLAQNAAFHLADRDVSPFDVSLRLNQIPMGALNMENPLERFATFANQAIALDATNPDAPETDKMAGGPAPHDPGVTRRTGSRRAIGLTLEPTTPFGRRLSFAKVYQFKITLNGTDPVVWRRIQVPGSYSFWDLHCAITDAFGWLDYHLHLFTVEDPNNGATVRFGIPDEDGGDVDFLGYETLPGWKTRISRFFTVIRAKAEYEYDFGDGWRHSVELEGILPKEAGAVYPRCLDGANACPPEDCGGTGGYEDFKQSLRDPGAEDRRELLEWVGGWFDPGWFDKEIVRFGDPDVRWQVAFMQKPVPRGLRTEQYHRLRRESREDK